MIKVTQIQEIRWLKNQRGLSFREIAKETGRNRKTVSRWYNSDDFPKYEREGSVNLTFL